jgi:hypothetical protein
LGGIAGAFVVVVGLILAADSWLRMRNSIKDPADATIGFSVFDEIQNGLRDLVDFIPNAISAGLTWADTVHQMMLETALSAESASGLMAVMQRVGVPIDAVAVGPTNATAHPMRLSRANGPRVHRG